MNKQNVWVIIGTSGDYDTYDKHVILSVNDVVLANLITQHLTELNEFNKAFNQRINNEFETPWVESNPPPKERVRPVIPEEMRRLGTLCSQKLATEEDKKAFRKLQAQHIKNIDNYNRPIPELTSYMNARQERHDVAFKNWCEINYVIPEHLKYVSEYIQYAPEKNCCWGNSFYDNYDYFRSVLLT